MSAFQFNQGPEEFILENSINDVNRRVSTGLNNLSRAIVAAYEFNKTARIARLSALHTELSYRASVVWNQPLTSVIAFAETIRDEVETAVLDQSDNT